MRVLGISAFYHDSAAALIADGRIVAAAQEERFSRKKFDANYPRHAVEYCLKADGVTLADVDYVAFYDKPFLKFERLLETYLTFSPRGFSSFRMALPLWLREKLFLKSLLASELKALEPNFDWDKRLAFSEHHLSHAASAFYPSPFQRAAVLTMDGVGEWATTSAGVGNGHELKIQKEINFPHSLGLLYAAFTYYTGFKVNSGEYKVMGLAPYGIPKYAQLIYDNLIDLKPDGKFDNIWVQPAAGDSGGALGAALTIYHLYADRQRTVANTPDGMVGSYLGPEFDDGETQTRLEAAGARYATLPRDRLIDRTAQALADGKAVGWFQGRMEFGPRALGNRSILADPRDPRMQKKLN